jgi:hypothetical protein
MSLVDRLRVGWVSHEDGELAAAEIERLRDEVERLKERLAAANLLVEQSAAVGDQRSHNTVDT